MTEVLKQPVTDRSAWTAADVQNDNSWLFEIDHAEAAEIIKALDVAKQNGVTVTSVTPADFPLSDKFVSRIDSMQTFLDNDRGFCVLRGLPISGYSVEDIEMMYAGVTSHFGTKIYQDTSGTLIDHVKNRGASYSDIAVRGYTTNAQLTPHCDSGDLVVLLCVNPAKSGGLNNVSSTMSIYNEIFKENPEYLDVLYKGFQYNIRGNGPVGEFQDITAHRVPVYSYHKGKLSARYNQKAIKTAPELPGVEPLSELEIKAIDRVAELANRDDLRFDFMLQSGDIAFLNNYLVFHNRGAFEDWEEPEKRRLLLRQWVNLHNGRELTEDFADHYNTGPKLGPAQHEELVGERNR